jgi:hypothetical protein
MALGRRMAATIALGVATGGCFDPNIYGTPRTASPGRLVHTISGSYVRTDGQQASAGPAYAMRVGVVDRMDVGLRLTGMMNAGLDVKWNFLRSSTLDLAIDPRIDWLFVAIDNRDRAVLAHLPVMVGINVAEPVTVGAVGAPYGAAPAAAPIPTPP